MSVELDVSVEFATNPEPIHKYNPAKAKELLKKAGVETLRVDLSVADAAFAGAIDAGALFQESAKAAGIDINLVKESDDSYWDVVWLKKPFVASYWNGRPSVDWMMTTAYAADAAWNDTFWNNPRFNQWRKGLAAGLATIVVVGNVSFPIAVLAGIVG